MIITIDLKELHHIEKLSVYDTNVYKLNTKIRDADLIRHTYLELYAMNIVELCAEINGKIKTLQVFTKVAFEYDCNNDTAILEIYL